MTAADRGVDRAADKLDDLADKAADSGGARAKLADTLAEDAAFLRKLKPSLVAARIRGNGTAEPPTEAREPVANAQPKRSGRGPNPFLVAVGAFVAGMLLAKLVDWRGHAHPRD